jgi:hypothetical protein
MAAARHEKFRFSDMDEDRRLAHVLRRLLETPAVRTVQKRLELLYRTAGIAREGDGALILGETGAGKTTAARMYVDAKYQELRSRDPTGEWSRPEAAGTDLRPIVHVTSSGIERPIVVVSVNARPRFNSLLRDTALAMQVPLGKNFDFGEAMTSVMKAIEKQKVKMIIFDDVQHIIDAGMNAFGAADVFKLFLKCRIAVVCIGLTHARSLASVNSQLDRLIQQRITIAPLRCSLGDFPEVYANGRTKSGETVEPTAFREVMEAIDARDGANSVLPFDEASNLSYPDMALRIHQASGGYIGEIMNLIHQASTLAILDGSTRVTMEDFAQAHENRTSCSDEANWFKMGMKTFTERFGTVQPQLQKEDAKKGAKAEKEVEKYLKRSGRRVADAFAGRK